MASQRSETDQTPTSRASIRRAFEAKRRPGQGIERDDRPHEVPSKRGDRRHIHAKLRELQSSDEDDWQDYEG